MSEGGTHRLLVGNLKWMVKNAVAVPRLPSLDLEGLVQQDEEEGRTVVHVAVDGRLVALVCIADPIKQEAPLAVAALQERGIRVALLTGDKARTAAAIARKVGHNQYT